MGQVKVLVVGSWFSTTYELPLYNAFKETCETDKFAWCTYFGFTPLSNKIETNGNFLLSIWYKFQNKFIIGPSVQKLNRDLKSKVDQFNPDLVLLYRPTHVLLEVVKHIKKNSLIFVYNNDDPFTYKLPKYVYRNYFSILPFADWIYAYRPKNISDYSKLNFNNTSILLPNFLQEKHFPLPKIEKSLNVIFIGHFEDDGRDDAIKLLIEHLGQGIEIWGNDWDKSRYYPFFVEYLKREIVPIFGEEYNKKINQSKIALVFLSKINNDTYTRRCFEIPATKTFMLCESSIDMKTFFTQGVEAEYFSTAQELTQRVSYYLTNPDELDKVREAAFKRVYSDGHEIRDRARQILADVKRIKESSSK